MLLVILYTLTHSDQNDINGFTLNPKPRGFRGANFRGKSLLPKKCRQALILHIIPPPPPPRPVPIEFFYIYIYIYINI